MTILFHTSTLSLLYISVKKIRDLAIYNYAALVTHTSGNNKYKCYIAIVC